jgi:hypothetical protein
MLQNAQGAAKQKVYMVPGEPIRLMEKWKLFETNKFWEGAFKAH